MTDTTISSTMKYLSLKDITQKQAIFDVGTAGHVAHGKSTLVKAITGTATQRYSKERERNITIKLGYANAKIYHNPRTGRVFSFPAESVKEKDPVTGDDLVFSYQISFVDCPGHHLYMAVMVSGSCIMDCCAVVVAANEPIPQPQTRDHLIALDYSGIKDIIYVMNKLDIVKPEMVSSVKDNLLNYLSNEFQVHNPSIYPISAVTGDNVDHVTHRLASLVKNRVEKTITQANEPLRMHCVRSYNINKPSTPVKDMVGAVVGGTISSGVLCIGDQVELRPGAINMINGKRIIQPLVGHVTGLQSDKHALQVAIPGGLIGVNLTLYAGLASGDRLKGQILGHVGTLPDIYDFLEGNIRTLEQIEFVANDKVQVVIDGITVVDSNIQTVKIKDGKGKISLSLSQPAVLDVNTSRAAIMYQNRLMASLKIKTGRLSLPVVYPEGVDYSWKPHQWTIVDDLDHVPPLQSRDSFEQLLPNVKYHRQQINAHVPPPQVIYPNHNTTVITSCELDNYLKGLSFQVSGTLQAQFKGEPVDMRTVIVTNIAKEINKSDPRFQENGNLLFKTKIPQQILSRFFSSMCQKLLTCISCKSQACVLRRYQRSYIRVCCSCGVESHVKSLMMSECGV
jgi:translation initiation factor 2 subunit 3